MSRRTYKQPITKIDQSNRTERRSVALRTSPRASEGGRVNVELWLSETSTIREVTRGVGDGLQVRLCIDVLLDDGLKSEVSITEEIDQNLQCESGVSGPGVVI